MSKIGKDWDVKRIGIAYDASLSYVNMRKEIEGEFDIVYSPELINEIVSEFVDGEQEVKITVGELKDALAYMFHYGLNDH